LLYSVPFVNNTDQSKSIINLYHAGMRVPDISVKLGVPKDTIWYQIRKFKKTGLTGRKPGSGRSRTCRTAANIRAMKTRVAADPFVSIRQMARELQINEKTARTICKEDLGLKSRARMKKQLVNQSCKEKRLDRSRKLLNILKEKKQPVILFTDEKIFDLDSVSNSRLDRYLSDKKTNKVPEHVRFKFQTKHPQNVMVFGLVASDGKTMPPFFWPKGTKVNADEYIKVLRSVVKPWVEANYRGVPYVFQQDGAPCHTANKTQKWLADHLRDFWAKDLWPPSSPDLNPLDFSVWDWVARRACKTPHPNLESLKAAIMAAWSEMSPDYIRATCQRFRPRLEAVVRAEGGHIED
jgi:inhibitor of nuclear factor kappa-B kinase subunit alpha